jgi:hypothetical protein
MISSDVQFYKVKSTRIPGSDFKDVVKVVRQTYKTIAKQTKRTPYVRSVYFSKDKIFLNAYWAHLSDTPRYAQKRRLQYFNCAVELLRHTTFDPETKPNPNGRNEIVHRFAGLTVDGEKFYVQVKQEIRSGKKYFMSVFPERN